MPPDGYDSDMGIHQRAPEGSLTLLDFLEWPDEDGYRLELSRGSLAREPAPGPRHGRIAGRLYRLLYEAGARTGAGEAFIDTGFLLFEDPPTVRVPDVAFVTAGRIPAQEPERGFWALAPDLVVEVVSPSNSASGLQRKALDYLEAGSRVVWVADPVARAITVYRSTSDIRLLQPGQTLSGDPVLPALGLDVGEVLGTEG